jgi:hypothetical protein
MVAIVYFGWHGGWHGGGHCDNLSWAMSRKKILKTKNYVGKSMYRGSSMRGRTASAVQEQRRTASAVQEQGRTLAFVL